MGGASVAGWSCHCGWLPWLPWHCSSAVLVELCVDHTPRLEGGWAQAGRVGRAWAVSVENVQLQLRAPSVGSEGGACGGTCRYHIRYYHLYTCC